MLESYCKKAQLVDGLDVLDLGCGALVPLSSLPHGVPLKRILGCARMGKLVSLLSSGTDPTIWILSGAPVLSWFIYGPILNRNTPSRKSLGYRIQLPRRRT